jgi:hypothetical protein
MQENNDINRQILEELKEIRRLAEDNNRKLRDRPPTPQPQPPRLQPVMPPPDDLDTAEIEIKQASADVDNNSTWNFMISSAIQVYGNYNSLPPEVVDYGLRTGRIIQ